MGHKSYGKEVEMQAMSTIQNATLSRDTLLIEIQARQLQIKRHPLTCRCSWCLKMLSEARQVEHILRQKYPMDN